MSQLFLGFKFYQDGMKSILFLAGVAFFGMAYRVYSYIRLKVRIYVDQDLSFNKMPCNSFSSGPVWLSLGWLTVSILT